MLPFTYHNFHHHHDQIPPKKAYIAVSHQLQTHLTVGALESSDAGARVILSPHALLLLLPTQRTVEARCRCARVVRQAARCAHESWGAVACERVDAIDACGSILTRPWCTLVDVDFAEVASESRLAVAGEGVDAVDAGAVVLAGLSGTTVGKTLVDVHVAVSSAPTRVARTQVGARSVTTHSIPAERESDSGQW